MTKSKTGLKQDKSKNFPVLSEEKPKEFREIAKGSEKTMWAFGKL